MESPDLGVFAGASDDIVNGGLLQPAHDSQFIDGDSVFRAQRPNAHGEQFWVSHDFAPEIEVLPVDSWIYDSRRRSGIYLCIVDMRKEVG